MKKFIVLFFLAFMGLFVSPSMSDFQCNAQDTKYYVYKYSFNTNGEKYNQNMPGKYIVFKGDQAFFTDKNGVNTSSGMGWVNGFERIGKRNGLWVYRYYTKLINYLYPEASSVSWQNMHLYVTPDYKTIYISNDKLEAGTVFELGKPGDEIRTPDTFY